MRVICLLFVVTPLAAQDLEPKPARSEFEMKQLRDFVNHALSTARARGSLRKLGEPTRTVHGRLIDHEGKPIAGAQVSFSTDIGYSFHSYDENFDITDEQGRFLVEGDFTRHRIVIWRGKGQMWQTYINRDQKEIEITWPRPARCSVTLDDSLRSDKSLANTLGLSTTQYAVGMAALRRSVAIEDNGPTVINDLLPGEYSVLMHKTVLREGETRQRHIEVGRFQVRAGESIEVHAGPNGSRRLTGKLKLEPKTVNGKTAPVKIPDTLFVEVRQQKNTYEQVTQLVDVLVTDKDLKFTTRPLPPGRYLLSFVGPTPERRQNQGFRGFGFESAPMPLQFKYRIVVPEADAPIELKFPPEPSLAFHIQQTLDTDGQMNVSWSYADVQAMQVAKQKDSTPELLRLLENDDTPQSWQYPLVKGLSHKLNDPKVVRELIRIAKTTTDVKKRHSIVSQNLRMCKILREEIAEALDPFRKDSDFRVRHMAYWTLPIHVTDKNRDQVIPWLIEGLSDPYPRTRYDIAAWMRRIDAQAAVPKLKELAKEDPSDAVRVTAAHTAAKLTGETKQAIQMMTVRLRGDTYCGQWEAAQLLSEYDELPEITLKTLESKIKKVKGPFGTLEKFEDNRISSTAKLTLKKVAPGRVWEGRLRE